MSITIRLAKFGKKHKPSYRMVVANTRDKRNGRFLDTLGHYNPSETPVKFSYDKKLYEEWIKKGALVTDAVKKLVEGTYEYKPYNPNAKEEDQTEDAQQEGKGAGKEGDTSGDEEQKDNAESVSETPQSEEKPADDTK